MRSSTPFVYLLPGLVAGHAIQPEPRPASAPQTAAASSATSVEVLGSEEVTPIPTANLPETEHLDLRQAPPQPEPIAGINDGIPANYGNADAIPGVGVHANPNFNPDAVQPATTEAPGLVGTSQLVDHYSTTVQWVETHITGPTTTSTTWIPVTVTFFFPAVASQGALPAKGEIGMGYWTEETGVTRTVVEGGAETVGCRLRGVVVAAGVGLAGLVI